MIVRRGKQYVVVSEKKRAGKHKKLGSYGTLAAAKKRLRQIEYFKHVKG